MKKLPEFIDTQAVMRLLNVKTRKSVFDRVKSSDFPKPQKFGGRKPLWSVSQVTAWIKKAH